MASDGMLSVVIPVYRSEAYLARTVEELRAYLEPRTPFEIILVNDGSPDSVQGTIDALCAADARIRSVELRCNLGQHRATLQGLLRARGEVVVTVDDDGQNPPVSVWAVAQALRTGDLDVVYGHFQVIEQSVSRKIASRVNRWLSGYTLRNRSGIAISNVRAIRGELARALGGVQSPYPYIDAMIFRMTNRIGEQPVEHRPRTAGSSLYTLRKLVALWLSHLTSLSVIPLQLAMLGSFGTSALGFIAGSVLMVRALLDQKAPEGWLSLFCAITFLFSLLFAFLGIISAYLGRMYVSLNESQLVWVRSERALGSSPADSRTS